jgi:hypothetical protein
MRRWLVLLFVSLPAQAFWYTAAGGVVGSWAGMQYGELVAQVQVSQAAAAGVLPTALPIPVVPAYAAEYFTPTPSPRPTARPTQTPRPLPPGRLPDRQPAVSPFVFAKR